MVPILLWDFLATSGSFLKFTRPVKQQWTVIARGGSQQASTPIIASSFGWRTLSKPLRASGRMMGDLRASPQAD